MNFDELKTYVIQAKAEKVAGNMSQSQAVSNVNASLKRPARCYNCDDNVHLGQDCPHPSDAKKCYKCGKFQNHRAKDCPYSEQRRVGQGGVRSAR